MGKLIVELPEELHGQLKKQAAAEHKTLKIIVMSLVHQYLKAPRSSSPQRTTRLCGAWKDRRSAKALLDEIRAARRWRIDGRS